MSKRVRVKKKAAAESFRASLRNCRAGSKCWQAFCTRCDDLVAEHHQTKKSALDHAEEFRSYHRCSA